MNNLEARGVEYIFGIPGAKIDNVFDTLVDSKIKTVVCRHEQNAAFIAAGVGRIRDGTDPQPGGRGRSCPGYLSAGDARVWATPAGDHLKSWLFTILRNIRFNQIRDGLSNSRSVETDGPSSTPEFEEKSSKDPLFLYLAKVRQADVRKAIEELPAVS